MLNSKHNSEIQLMPVRLRGHHFLCMLTYRGLGYSSEFTTNMTAIINRVQTGTPVVLVNGPDDICAGMSKACTHATGHDCRGLDILDMDKTAQAAVETVLMRDLANSVIFSADELQKLRAAFASGFIRAACNGCSWLEICNQIVDQQFYGTQLLMVKP